MFHPSKTLLVAVLPLVLSMGVGCKKKAAPIEEPDATAQVVTPPTRTREAATGEDLDQLRLNFEKVHFEVDQSDLSDGAKAALRDNAEILKRYSATRVEIQGHADERGTTDYNLALGARRAESVKAFLLAQGVDAGQLRTISYGEERPAVAASTVVAWAENRRAEFRILQAPNDPAVQVEGSVGQ